MKIELIKKQLLESANNKSSNINQHDRFKYIQGQNSAIHTLFINGIIDHETYKELYDCLFEQEDSYLNSFNS